MILDGPILPWICHCPLSTCTPSLPPSLPIRHSNKPICIFSLLTHFPSLPSTRCSSRQPQFLSETSLYAVTTHPFPLSPGPPICYPCRQSLPLMVRRLYSPTTCLLPPFPPRQPQPLPVTSQHSLTTRPLPLTPFPHRQPLSQTGTGL